MAATDEPAHGASSVARTWSRSTLVTGALLLAIAGLAWARLLLSAAGMTGDTMSDGMAMESTEASAVAAAAVFVVSWTVMMAAMMLPSAIPMIALYGAVRRNNRAAEPPGAPTVLFALVYIAIWSAVGLPAYLGAAAIASAQGAMLLPLGVTIVLVLAGAYQLTPLKQVCLRTCRSPLGFLIGNWRPGYAGTLRLAVMHALYCLGCCWALMVVLVAAGAMGIAWVALIALAVFVEKILPYGEWSARGIGVGLIGLGLLVLARPEIASTLRGAM